MKKTIFLLCILTSIFASAQITEKISYQAIIRDASGELVTSSEVGLKISILQNAFSEEVYTETHSTQTNQNGLVSLQIGAGETLDDFSEIDWANGPYFIKVETDITGGSNYSITSVSELLSVPYALYAKTSGSTTPGPPGQDGVGIESTVDNNNGTFTLNFTDGSSFTTADLTGPQGEKGLLQEGNNIGDMAYWNGNEWVIDNSLLYNDGTNVGIGTNTPDTSAGLDVDFTNKGFLPPRMSTAQRDAIENPAEGLMIFNVTSKCPNYYSDSTWYEWCGTEDGSGTENGSATYPPGTVHCSGTPTEVVDVTNPSTGKTWMDRNLGASQAATSSTDAAAYGDLYQWGRGADGHQCRTSPTTTTLSSTDQPGHGDFILAPNSPNDWRSPQNTNLWQGVSGTNNPCPSGYRLPTETELNAERTSWSSNNAAGAFASPLKLPMAGNRLISVGSLSSVGTFGYYWSSSVSSANSRRLGFSSGDASMYTDFRARGFSVRCLKD